MPPYREQEMTDDGITVRPVRAFRLAMSAVSSIYSSRIHTNNLPRLRDRPYHQTSYYKTDNKLRKPIKKDDSDDPAGNGCLGSDVLKAGFTVFSKPGLFLLFRYYVGCRSPPPVLHFSDF
jgi:hypothetical protein